MELKFLVSGMTCAACSARVEKVTKSVAGVHKAEVNLLAGTMTVGADSDEIIQPVINAIRAAGYEASVPGIGKVTEKEIVADRDNTKLRIVVSAVLLIILMYFTMGHMLGLPLPSWYHGTENALVAVLLQLTLTLPVVFLNRVYYMRGFKALWNRAPNMDSLIAVGSGAALIYGVVALFRMSLLFLPCLLPWVTVIGIR